MSISCIAFDGLQYNKPKNYDKELHEFIKNIISSINSNQDAIEKISSNDTWEIAFTHITYNPNPGENYEIFEKIGDAAMKLAFSEYLFQKFDMITESEIGEYQNHFLSKVEQSKLSNEVGLPDFILTPLPKTIHMAEDVLESFFGALLLIGNNYKFGLGYVLCYNLIVLLFEDINLEEEEDFSIAKTNLKELLEEYGLNNKPENVFNKDSPDSPSGTANLYFTPDDYNQMLAAGVKIKDRLMASAHGSTKKVATNDASEIFYNKLLELGKQKAFQEFVNKRKEKNKEFDILMEKAKKVAKKIGYANLEIRISVNGKNGAYAQLIGTRESDGKLENIGLTSGNKIKLMKNDLLEEFIRNNK